MQVKCVPVLAFVVAAFCVAPATATDETPIQINGQTWESWEAYFTSDYFRDNGMRCGTPRATEATTPEGLVPSDCTVSFTNPDDALYGPQNGSYDIQVVVHVLAHGNGTTGNIPDLRIFEQIQILNEDLNAIPGSNGEPGNFANVNFCLASIDPQGQPTNGITRSFNTTWYNDGGSYWNSLAWDPTRYMNIYTNQAGGNLGYVPFLPQTGGGNVGQPVDRVVCLWSAFGITSGSYGLGRTATHEVGHYLGLHHTFDSGCGVSSSPGCYTSGDHICDTKSESGPEFGCPAASSSCGTPDPVHNYMDYSVDACMNQFTFEQVRRIRCTIDGYRNSLPQSCNLVAVNDAGSQSLYSLQNHPNPFNPTTRISFEMAEPGLVSLQILDVSGRVIRTLAQGTMTAGAHSLAWDGRNDEQASVSSGVYFYRLDADGASQTRRMVLLK